MNTYHNKTIDETVKETGGNIHNGLSSKEAARRLRQNGPNALPEKKSKPFIIRFFSQFGDFMTVILLIAAGVSFALSLIDGDADISEPVIILAIVVMNALIGVIQESRAEKSLEKLKELSQPHARVIRDGKETIIPAAEVVVGDTILFSSGDIVCADCRLVNAVSLSTDESSLTGESGAVEKEANFTADAHASLGDRKNMLYSSSPVISGKCSAIVTAIGSDTEVGNIAQMLAEAEAVQTPLQKKLAKTGKVLGTAALIICAAVFAVGLMRKMPALDMFMTSVSLAVAAIPEGLPAIVTIMLALGVMKMSRHNAIVRHLPSVETLGSASVICTDKTGTLTRNRMHVTAVYSKDEQLTLRLAAMCSDKAGAGGQNPTDRAVISAASENGILKAELDKKYPRISEIPFDSSRKRMTTMHKTFSGKRTVVKGALEYVLPLCTQFHNGTKAVQLSQGEKSRITSQNAKMTAEALRVIAVAYRDDSSSASDTPSENNLIFSGLIGIEDPPRKEAVQAVETCKRAGIRPVMITGDHAGTAKSIAVRTGIANKEDAKVITGAELDKMSDAFLEGHINEFPVFARVTPAHKARIVKAWQKRGAVVAMTGDGVNDAPALSGADIGCSMGISGTEVAKSASDMILTDDNFATIVYAVKEGRTIFANIKKAVQFLLSSNIGEILTVFAGILFGWPAPLTATQLLWVNLVTDSLPAIALGLDPADKDIMEKPPRPKEKSLFADGMSVSIVFEGLMIGALSLLSFVIGANIFGNLDTGRTMAFATLSLSELVHAFNMRSEGSSIRAGLFKNKYLVLSFIAGVFLETAVISIPAASVIFNSTPLNGIQWIITAVLSIMPLIIVEAQKAFTKRMQR